jgi:hypothetical protein
MGQFCYNSGMVTNKESAMGQFGTGATVTKIATLYRVEYKNQIVAEFAIKDLAIMLAINQAELENSLQTSNIYLLKAA